MRMMFLCNKWKAILPVLSLQGNEWCRLLGAAQPFGDVMNSGEAGNVKVWFIANIVFRGFRACRLNRQGSTAGVV